MPAKKEIFGGEKRATGDVQASRVLDMYEPAIGGLRPCGRPLSTSFITTLREAQVAPNGQLGCLLLYNRVNWED